MYQPRNPLAQDIVRMEPVSLSLDDVRAIKRYATCNASYVDRVSLGFAMEVVSLGKARGEDRDVLHEIAVLEGFASHSSTTKEAAQFRRPPLHPFWHKHFSTTRHLLRNAGERWGLEKSNNHHELAAMIENVATEYGDQPDLWQKRLAHQFIFGGIEDRVVAKRMTGDWIIFAKHQGQNFYLGLATHEEATQDPDALHHRLRQCSAWEFSFLFA